MRTHVLQTYVHRIYDKSDAVTTFATVMNYQICDAHSAASYMCNVHCASFMWQIYVQRYLCVCLHHILLLLEAIFAGQEKILLEI